MNSSKNIIVKNSIILYVRMLFTMGISVYTSRVVLDILGVTDFGIYNVVGGIVVVLGFISGSLAGASTRYVTFALGSGGDDKVQRIFSTLLILHRVVALFLMILVEIVGIWFLYNKMNIPENRINAAFWVLQCSVLTSTISMVSVPYNSLIIAYERMDAFAFISMFESIAKLAIVYLLLFLGNIDKLIIYAILICGLQLVIRLIYSSFCRKNFKICHTYFDFDWKLIKEIFVFVGWKINGDLAFIGCGQGLNIVLNLFFGPVVNAARGISVQVQNMINTFIQSYQMAFQPQIVKNYASGNFDYMEGLVIISSKYGFYLMLMIAYPLLNYTGAILDLWLVTVPDDTIFLVQIIILVCFISPLRQPLIQSINATGKIKRFQILEGTTLLMVIPVVFVGLKYFHFTLFIAMYFYLCIEYIAQIIRVWVVLPYIRMSYMKYFKSILAPIAKVLIVLIGIRFFITSFFVGNIWNFVGGLILSEICCFVTCFVLGINRIERKRMITFITTKLKNGTR